jgi:hydrogenase-4 component B
MAVLRGTAGLAIALLGVAVITGGPVSLQAGDVLGFVPLDLRYDAVSGLFLLALGGVAVAAAIYAAAYHAADRSPLDAVAYATFVAGMLLVLGAANVFAFLLAWELMALASAALVFGPRPDPSTSTTGYLYLAITHLATTAIVVAFAVLAAAAGSLEIVAFPSAAAALPAPTRDLLFGLLLVGFGTKAGLVPFHIWLPRAHPVAPSHVSALMSGVMVATGVYGLLRFVVTGLGAPPTWWALAVLALGIASAVLGALYALAERDLKRLLAFSTIENMGIVLLGVGVALVGRAAGSEALATLGLTAALVHVLNHALFKGLLFLGAGAVGEAAGTRDLDRLGGLVRAMPLSALLFGVGAVAAASLPPLNGFSGEWLTFRALLAGGGASDLEPVARFATALAVGGLALTAALAVATFVKATGMTFLALPRSRAAAEATEVRRPLLAAMGLLGGLCLAAGLAAGPLGSVMGGVAEALLAGDPGPVDPAPSSVVPDLALGLVAAALATAAIATWALLRWRGGPARRALTWTCGVLPEPAFEYTATSFEKPARLFFEPVYRAQRDLLVEHHPGTPFPRRIRYRTVVDHALESRVYRPVHHVSVRFAQAARRIQHGSLQGYLLYTLVAVVVLLLVAR